MEKWRAITIRNSERKKAKQNMHKNYHKITKSRKFGSINNLFNSIINLIFEWKLKASIRKMVHSSPHNFLEDWKECNYF